MKYSSIFSKIRIAMFMACGLFAAHASHAAGGSVAADSGTTALLTALPSSKMTLMDGLKQASRGSEVAISAKFELDDHKQLSLSVYTAEKGLRVEPEKNVLKELSGSPEQGKWVPVTEVFKDLPHVARAAQHLVLAAQLHGSLNDVVADAARRNKGTVYSISPVLQDGKPVLIALVAKQGKVSTFVYEIPSGKLIAEK